MAKSSTAQANPSLRVPGGREHAAVADMVAREGSRVGIPGGGCSSSSRLHAGRDGSGGSETGAQPPPRNRSDACTAPLTVAGAASLGRARAVEAGTGRGGGEGARQGARLAERGQPKASGRIGPRCDTSVWQRLGELVPRDRAVAQLGGVAAQLVDEVSGAQLEDATRRLRERRRSAGVASPPPETNSCCIERQRGEQEQYVLLQHPRHRVREHDQ